MSPLAIFYGSSAIDFGLFSEDRCIKEKPQRAVRSVKFSKAVRVKEIPHYNELPDEEFQAIWYSAEDYQHFRSVCTTTVKIMTSGDGLHDEEDLCSRGLECKTKDGYLHRQRNKQRVRRAVFREQDIQFDEGIYDEEMITQASLEATSSARAIARTRGLADEEGDGDIFFKNQSISIRH